MIFLNCNKRRGLNAKIRGASQILENVLGRYEFAIFCKKIQRILSENLIQLTHSTLEGCRIDFRLLKYFQDLKKYFSWVFLKNFFKMSGIQDQSGICNSIWRKAVQPISLNFSQFFDFACFDFQLKRNQKDKISFLKLLGIFR